MEEVWECLFNIEADVKSDISLAADFNTSWIRQNIKYKVYRGETRYASFNSINIIGRKKFEYGIIKPFVGLGLGYYHINMGDYGVEEHGIRISNDNHLEMIGFTSEAGLDVDFFRLAIAWRLSPNWTINETDELYINAVELRLSFNFNSLRY